MPTSTVDDHVPRPNRTAALADGPDGDQPTTAMEPSRAAARLRTQVEAHGPRLAGAPHREPAGRVEAWMDVTPLPEFTTQTAVRSPAESEARRLDPTKVASDFYNAGNDVSKKVAKKPTKTPPVSRSVPLAPAHGRLTNDLLPTQLFEASGLAQFRHAVKVALPILFVGIAVTLTSLV